MKKPNTELGSLSVRNAARQVQDQCHGLAYEAAVWQPIETAPRDGTHVIAYRPTTPPHVEGMYWAEYEQGGGAWHWSYDGDCPNSQPPTLWMPLLPPTTQSQEL